MCVTKVFSAFDLGWGLTPGPKFTKSGDDLPPTQVYRHAKFDVPYRTSYGQTKKH